MQPYLFNYQNLHIMALGLFWVPRNLNDYSSWGRTCYTINNYQVRDNIIYDFLIQQQADDYSLLERWRTICRQLDIYMILYNDRTNSIDYYVFKRALPNALGATPWGVQFTMTSSNVEKIYVLPDFLNASQDLGITLAAARRDSYQ